MCVVTTPNLTPVLGKRKEHPDEGIAPAKKLQKLMEDDVDLDQSSNVDNNKSGKNLPDPNDLKESLNLAFIQAARAGDLNKLKKLVDNGQDINTTHIGYSALHYAVFYNHRSIVEYLLDEGANIDIIANTGLTPLMWGVDRGHVELVGFLLECEADPAIVNQEGFSALHFAVRSKNYAMVEMLLSFNTETEEWTKVNGRTKTGYTAINFAAFDGSLKILQLLVEYGGNVNICSYSNVSPLHRAITKKHIDVVEFLLENGADVDKNDDNKRTGLHIAALSGELEIVKLLCKYNASLNLDISDNTPITLAKIRKFNSIQLFLQEYEKNMQ